MDPIVIIGSGLAGYTVAKEYRKLKSDDVVLITQDDGAFYSKPMVSNALVKNKTSEQLVIASAVKMSEDNNLRVKCNTSVTNINLAEKKLITSSGDELVYSQLVLATGAMPIEIDLEASVAKKLFHVNSLQDYALFRDALESSKRVAIIGSGFIGCEFANDLAQAGYKVDIIGKSEYPLDKWVPEAVGEFLKNALSSVGVRWHLQTTLESVHATKNNVSLLLKNGAKIEADIILSAIGLKPNLKLAERVGIKTRRGILVDKFLHTSEKGIFALGDCSELDGHILPFILPLMTEARALAKTLTGIATAVEYPVMPVVVKTPVSPLVICPHDKGIAGRWVIEASETGVKACFQDKNKQLRGFCLIGDRISEKQSLAKLLKN